VSAADLATVVLLTAGAAFFVAGTAGMLRFPDTHSRLHALTKADNLGLGLVAAGLLPQAATVASGLQVLLVWLLALVASASASYLIAGEAVAGRDDGAGPGEASDG
jgi:multicomponent Na+:H+ antiporter subunit G